MLSDTETSLRSIGLHLFQERNLINQIILKLDLKMLLAVIART